MNRILGGAALIGLLFGLSRCGSSSSDSGVKLDCGTYANSSKHGCNCSTFTNGEPNGTVQCSAARFPGTLCCAESGWPASGHSCVCMTLDDGSEPSSCNEIQFADQSLPNEVSACDLHSSAPSGGGGASGTGGSSGSQCNGQGVKDYCTADASAGEFGSDCCPGLLCTNGAFGNIMNNPYNFRCSRSGCQNYDGSCNTDEDCCGPWTCTGHLCN